MIAALVASLVGAIALFAGVVLVARRKWRRDDEDERRMEWMQ